jgi:hypothetical protein
MVSKTDTGILFASGERSKGDGSPFENREEGDRSLSEIREKGD